MKQILALLLVVMLLCTGCIGGGPYVRETELPTESSIPEHTIDHAWAELLGYWHADEGRYFLVELTGTGEPVFAEGIWGSGSRGAGVVEDLTLTSPTVLTAVVCYEATAGTEMDPPLPEAAVPLTIDWTNLDNDGKIRITFGETSWYCAWAGADAGEAYARHQQDLLDMALSGGTEEEQLHKLWNLLEGCWDSGDYFAEFSWRDGIPVLLSGRWGDPVPYNREAGEVYGLTNFNDIGYTFGITYPPNEENAADEQDLQPILYTIVLGLDDYAMEQTIVLELPVSYYGTFAYCGGSYEEICLERGITPRT